MKTLLDSSVLLAAFLPTHVHHEPSFRVFEKCNKKQDCCAAHSLAEFYAVATRLPGRNRLSSGQALPLLQNVRDRLTIVSLKPAEYFSALAYAAAEDISGGAIYDFLIARCALKANAERLYTWNSRHFERLGSEIARKVRAPE